MKVWAINLDIEMFRGEFVGLNGGAEVAALVGEGLLHPHLSERIPAGITRLYSHQEHAIRAIAQLGRTPVSALIVAGLLENCCTCLETIFVRILQSFENRLDRARCHRPGWPGGWELWSSRQGIEGAWASNHG